MDPTTAAAGAAELLDGELTHAPARDVVNYSERGPAQGRAHRREPARERRPHTPAGSRIWIRCWREDAAAVIAVEDDGPGVPAELRTQIFEAFYRGPDSGRTPGSGIGLLLVARFAEMHGGRAWVQEREGGGSSFRVLLPNASR